jgi:hypothetical protein
MEEKRKSHATMNDNKNEVKVNNQLAITINFGDSLNLLALVFGMFVLRKFLKVKKSQS